MRKEFTCELCDFKTSYKGDYKKHIKTKKHQRKTWVLSGDEKNLLTFEKNQHKTAQIFCGPAQNKHKPAQTSTSEEIFNCEHCHRIFKTNDNLIRHKKKYCKVKKQQEEELEHIKTLLEEERAAHIEEKKRLYNCIDNLIQKAGNTTTITNNTQNNICLKILNFGD